jgi:hypothetical protein
MSEAKKPNGAGHSLAQIAISSRSKRHSKEARRSLILDRALADVAERRTPNLNGRDDLGIVHVPDPDAENCEIRAKVVNYRDDPLGQMAARGQLGNEAETAVRLGAGRKWQKYYERAEIGGAKAIDPSKPYIDGGAFVAPETDQRSAAMAEMKRLRPYLGIIGEQLITWVLGEKLTLGQVAQRRRRYARMDQVVIGHEFRQYLDLLAVLFGMAHDKKGARGPWRGRDEFDELAKSAHNPVLHRAIGLAKVSSPKRTP